MGILTRLINRFREADDLEALGVEIIDRQRNLSRRKFLGGMAVAPVAAAVAPHLTELVPIAPKVAPGVDVAGAQVLRGQLYGMGAVTTSFDRLVCSTGSVLMRSSGYVGGERGWMVGEHGLEVLDDRR